MNNYRVMKIHEFEKSVFYRVACNCGDEQCDLTLELEYDPELQNIVLNMYKNLRASAHWGYTDAWYYFDFFRVLFNKIKMCWKIMTKGYIEISECMMITGGDHIDNFIKALEDGKEYVQNGNTENNEER